VTALPGGLVPVALAAAAGGLLAVAVRELVLASPSLARSLSRALDPLRRAGSEGYEPSGLERRRLAVIGTLGALLAVVLAFGPGPVALLALAAPALVGWTLATRRARYRRGVERGLPAAATAIADALSGGHSPRAGVIVAAESVEGPIAVELAQVRADLELGAPIASSLGGLRRRVPSARIDSLVTALCSQQLGGGDLAGLLRRHAQAGAERQRVVADARSASAQARFTGLLVVAMPVAAALFGELVFPGFVGRVLAESASAMLLGLAAVLQLAAFFAIRRLSRVEA
jgi:tight adherence protein B